MRTFFELLSLGTFAFLFALLMTIVCSMYVNDKMDLDIIYVVMWFASYGWAAANLGVHTTQRGGCDVYSNR